MPTYPDFDDKYEYLDLSHRNMPVDDLKDILYDLIDDTMILHINLSYLVTEETTANPAEMEPLIKMLIKSLRENAYLIALDWAGNHLGDHAPHPTNQHTMDYIAELADALAKSSVKRIDLSDNMITGPRGRKLSGVARIVRHCIPSKWQVLRFRSNNLNGLAIGLFGEALGLNSKLVELDLSNNQAGRDPHNRPSCDGIKVLCVNLAETHTLRKLKLARNLLADEEIVELSKALIRLPNLMVLDLSGNDFRDVGMRALREAISSHASFFKPRCAETIAVHASFDCLK
jgi:Ran GTPase-activating protein (RanGAP) involved in mRNA processing and transport